MERKMPMGITEWLSANIATLIAAAVLVLIMVLLIRSKIRERRQGGCGCGCPGCSGSCTRVDLNSNTEGKSNEA